MQENYQNTELVFLDIANIHVMRERYTKYLTMAGHKELIIIIHVVSKCYHCESNFSVLTIQLQLFMNSEIHCFWFSLFQVFTQWGVA